MECSFDVGVTSSMASSPPLRMIALKLDTAMLFCFSVIAEDLVHLCVVDAERQTQTDKFLSGNKF